MTEHGLHLIGLQVVAADEAGKSDVGVVVQRMDREFLKARCVVRTGGRCHALMLPDARPISGESLPERSQSQTGGHSLGFGAKLREVRDVQIDGSYVDLVAVECVRYVHRGGHLGIQE